MVHRRALIGRYRKAHLLSRERCFDAGCAPAVFQANGLRFGINICHDTNFATATRGAAALGALLILCPANNMLPQQAAQKWKHLHNAIRAERCRETGMWLISADVMGERDGCVSWGPTAVITPAGEVAAQLPLGRPGLLVFDLPIGGAPSPESSTGAAPPARDEPRRRRTLNGASFRTTVRANNGRTPAATGGLR